MFYEKSLSAAAMKARLAAREITFFAIFLGLTVVMTWPWALHLRDAAGDRGDSYLNAWILWWDYHQTFHNPLDLFNANILYPYRYTLAFSENNYGIALFFFPLYALGLTPLTVHGVATLFGFAFCGYGAFRLTRTLTGSTGASWIAGVAFAFLPYRFHHLPHITYLCAGWIPILLEAVILYSRSATWQRAVWLGLAFFMNALSCIHWMVLTFIPLGLTFLLLLFIRRALRDRTYWLRALIAIVVASFALLPFLIPYLRVSKMYGLVRGREEATFFSAHLMSWLTADWQSKFWPGMGSSVSTYTTELALFPGLLVPLLALSALLLHGKRLQDGPDYLRVLVVLLDVLVIFDLVASVLAAGYGHFPGLNGFGVKTWLMLAAVTLAGRLVMSPPKLRLQEGQLRKWLETGYGEALAVGLLWTVIGFVGSFGMNFFFHRFLFNFIPLFRSIRVPARWAMICFVGLSILAGIGAMRVAESFGGGSRKYVRVLTYALLVAMLLVEQREAPLILVGGDADPDAITLYLKKIRMSGGIVELPAGIGQANYMYTLRAADHVQPLVNGVSGFRPPIVTGIEEMSQQDPVSDRFLDLLEAVPVSYLVVHLSALDEPRRRPLNDFLKQAVAAKRLLPVRDFAGGNDQLFVVTKTEPQVLVDKSY